MTPLVRPVEHPLGHLDLLESLAIFIIREVAAESERPVLLFSGGKDSAVLLHLAAKAFAPGRIPFPVMHVDTGHNFPEVLSYRDAQVESIGARLLVASVQESIDQGRVADPGPDGSRNRLQTTTLLDAINANGFDAAFGGARRDEDKARAKERVLSFRDSFGQWDPKRQRPELWQLYQGTVRPGEHLRAFPLSDWTELDIWQYIRRERIELPSIYYAHEREVVERDGMLLALSEWVSPQGSEEVRQGDGALPDRRRRHLHRGRALGCRHGRGDHPRGGRFAHLGAGGHQGRRPLLGDVHGGPQARGIFLVPCPPCPARRRPAPSSAPTPWISSGSPRSDRWTTARARSSAGSSSTPASSSTTS